jgi:hypothetical protein
VTNRARVSGLADRIQERRPDLLAVLLLVGIVVGGVFPLIYRGITAGIDTLDFFYPMFSFLGEQLRSGNVPGWNPYQFSGIPFAADPESGWTYLPAMLVFAALRLVPAATTLILFHFLLAALSMYAFARVIGLTVVGSFVAAAGFALSHFLYTRSICCPAHIFVMTWIPAILLFVVLASSLQTWLARVICWSVAGLALSQTIAAWLGQGSYYVLLLTAGFVAYQELIWRPRPAWSIFRRIGRLAISLGAVFGWAAGFSAAGVLPRFEFVNTSNLAGGYEGHSATQGGLSAAEALTYPLIFGGVTIVALAVIAPVLARHRFQTPFFVAVAVVALILSLRDTTPLHAAAYAFLPRFEVLHRHSSERILVVFYPVVSLLAGVAVSSIRGWPRLTAALVTVVLANLLLVNWSFPLTVSRHLDLDAYFSPASAAEFLRSQQDQELSRYFGYDPQVITHRDGQEVRYLWHMFEPEVTALLVNNRATLLRLNDIQGYNPVQLQRYVELFDRMNGEAQEYHGRYVLPGGLDSPLLDLLNARFVVMPAEISGDRADLQGLVETHPVVYRDATVLVAENASALPRAWIVHEARQVEPGTALDLIASGAVDARATALLEAAPPPLTPALDPFRDRAAIERDEPDAIRVRTRTDAPGLLVLSEIYYPAWQAYVDGTPVSIFVTDHVLRAVPLPAGDHVVEFRYESTALRLGLVISLTTCVAFGVLSAALVARQIRTRRWTWPSVGSGAGGCGTDAMGL